MAKYLINESAYVDGKFFEVFGSPTIITLPDTTDPGPWQPLDDAAVEAFARIGIKKELTKQPENAQPTDDTVALSEIKATPAAAAAPLLETGAESSDKK